MSLPVPLVSADVDLRDFQFMPLHVAQLLDSETWMLCSGDEAKAMVTLWCKSWHQKPAASLPKDDRVLAILSGAGAKWKKIKATVLRGFVECSDGRLYHRVIAALAADAWASKLAQRERTRAATEAREKRRKEREDGERDNHPRADVQRNDQRNVERDVHQGTGTGTGTGNQEDAVADAGEHNAIRMALDSIGAWDDQGCRLSGARVLAWLRSGADLDLDILPTLQAVIVRAREREGPNWLPASMAYFDKPITTAVAQRTNPMPASEIARAQRNRPQSQPSFEDEIRANRTATVDALAGELATLRPGSGRSDQGDFGDGLSAGQG